METDRSRAEDEAIAWRLRLQAADGDEWTRFAQWLEADAANASAYEMVALADAEAAELLRSVEIAPDRAVETASAANDVERSPRGRYAWYGLGLSSAVAAVILIWVAPTIVRSTSSIVSTAPGERRSIALADGTRIDMNGGTRLSLDSSTPRSATLVSGEASFTVHHDASAPFEVLAGEAQIRDIGTAFDVVREAGAVDVSIASGTVLYNPGGEHLQLGAGDAIHDPDGPGLSVRSHVDATTVGDWRMGRLVFKNATLAQVARAIARNIGVPVTVAPTIASRSFDGVIITRGDRETLFRRLGPVLGVAVQRDGAAIHLQPVGRAGD